MNHLNELIALELGWRDLRPAMSGIGRGQSTGIPPGELRTYVPNWAGDLNLMQELQNGLTCNEGMSYGVALLELAGYEKPHWQTTIAAFELIDYLKGMTAEQKAIAWLKVKGVKP